MPKSNNPYDLINALEDRYDELTMNASSNIYSATETDEADEEKDPEVEELWNLITDYHIATEDELQLLTKIFGYNVENLNKVIHERTGYDDIDTYLAEVYPEEKIK